MPVHFSVSNDSIQPDINLENKVIEYNRYWNPETIIPDKGYDGISEVTFRRNDTILSCVNILGNNDAVVGDVKENSDAHFYLDFNGFYIYYYDMDNSAHSSSDVYMLFNEDKDDYIDSICSQTNGVGFTSSLVVKSSVPFNMNNITLKMQTLTNNDVSGNFVVEGSMDGFHYKQLFIFYNVVVNESKNYPFEFYQNFDKYLCYRFTYLQTQGFETIRYREITLFNCIGEGYTQNETAYESTYYKTIYNNGVYDIRPSFGYNAISNGVINVQVPTNADILFAKNWIDNDDQVKELPIIKNGKYKNVIINEENSLVKYYSPKYLADQSSNDYDFIIGIDGNDRVLFNGILDSSNVSYDNINGNVYISLNLNDNQINNYNGFSNGVRVLLNSIYSINNNVTNREYVEDPNNPNLMKERVIFNVNGNQNDDTINSDVLLNSNKKRLLNNRDVSVNLPIYQGQIENILPLIKQLEVTVDGDLVIDVDNSNDSIIYDNPIYANTKWIGLRKIIIHSNSSSSSKILNDIINLNINPPVFNNGNSDINNKTVSVNYSISDYNNSNNTDYDGLIFKLIISFNIFELLDELE